MIFFEEKLSYCIDKSLKIQMKYEGRVRTSVFWFQGFSYIITSVLDYRDRYLENRIALSNLNFDNE